MLLSTIIFKSTFNNHLTQELSKLLCFLPEVSEQLFISYMLCCSSLALQLFLKCSIVQGPCSGLALNTCKQPPSHLPWNVRDSSAAPRDMWLVHIPCSQRWVDLRLVLITFENVPDRTLEICWHLKVRQWPCSLLRDSLVEQESSAKQSSESIEALLTLMF